MGELPRCCMDMDIKLEHLLFPERMSEAGQEFVVATGLSGATLLELREHVQDLGDGMVKIVRRCDQLLDDGRCSMYENRPQICRDFDCATRSDCACGGSGRCGG